MRYVTESELRDEYAACPFETYRLAPDTRLTPGARQFLVDFRITFDAGAAAKSVAARGASAPADQRLCDSFLDDVRVLGAKLCLFSQRSQGICRALARVCGAAGAAWQRGEAGVVADADGEAPGELPVPAPELHPIYFEAALIDAELVRTAHFWTSAAADMAEEPRARVEAWSCEAQRIRSQIAHAIALAQEEVDHG